MYESAQMQQGLNTAGAGVMAKKAAMLVGLGTSLPPSPVGACLSRLLDTQGQTHELLVMLEQRLSGAMRSSYPQPDSKEACDQPESELCGEILGRISSAECINSRIRMILDRLTV